MRKVALALLVALSAPFAASAAIIDNGTIQLGVDDFGQLNVGGGVASPVSGTTTTGLRHMETGYEATAHGCLCEGWGVGIGETGQYGSANNSFGGADNLTLSSFGSTATTATSVVTVDGTGLKVTHHFMPSAATPDLYQVRVTIENTGGADITDLRYTRTFDWDVEPTAFSEYVTHAGVATTPSVLSAVDNGFVDSNPFASRSNICSSGGDFVDAGSCDNGSNFDFGFGELKVGESYEFDIFYGASRTEAGALAALGTVGAELYSLGQSSLDEDGDGFTDAGLATSTFIFAFKGVGGIIVVPPPAVPLPASGLLLLGGAGLLGALRRRRRPMLAA